MVTCLNPFESGQTKYVGLSTDTKPDGKNGDLFIEIDTGSKYLYSKEDETWYEFSSGGSADNIVGTAIVGTAKVG